MPDLNSRTARLEQKSQQYDIELRDIKTQLKDMSDKQLSPIRSDVNQILVRLERQRGFMAGAMFAVSVVWAIIGYAAYAAKDMWSSWKP